MALLRDAVPIARLDNAAPHTAKQQKVAPSGGMLFRGLELMPTVPDSPAIMQADEQASHLRSIPCSTS